MTSRKDGFMAVTICLLLCLISGMAGAGVVLAQKDSERDCSVTLRDQNGNLHVMEGKCHG